MKTKRACASVCLVALGCLAGGAWAAPISYVEGPDLSDTFLGTNLGSLDVGSNTVRGRISAICTQNGTFECSPNDQSDAFAVQLPTGLEITAVTFVVSNYGALGVIGRARDIDSYAPLSFDFTFSSAGPFSLPGLPAAGPGDLVFWTGGELVGPPSGQTIGVVYDYLWSITVAPVGQVPESGTLSLLGIALAGLALTWRARRR